MKAYKCDRCKKLYSEPPLGECLYVVNTEQHYDLCPKCYTELDRWFHMLPKRPKKTVDLPIEGGFKFE